MNDSFFCMDILAKSWQIKIDGLLGQIRTKDSNILKLILNNLVASYTITQMIIKDLLFGRTC